MSICLTERCSESTHHSQHNELTMVCFCNYHFFAVSLRILRRIIQNILHKTSCQTKENVL